MTNLPRDPWVHVRTYHDLPADQVISALQKEIRRGNTENAALLAYEMHLTSPEMEEKLWHRLMVISVEDIGYGDLNAPNLVMTLYRMFQHFPPGAVDRPLFSIHAVRYLCGCRKDRSSDELANVLRHGTERGEAAPRIPDYALDMHTAQGQAMGRGLEHFFKEGARVAPELPDRDTSYRERLLKMLGLDTSTA